MPTVAVGGLAVVLQGHARLTVDADLIVDLGNEQARRTIDALTGLGLEPRVPVSPQGFADPSVREEWIRVRRMEVFSMYDPSNPMRVIEQLEAILQARQRGDND